VVTYSEPKSISRETTFERDLHAVRDRATLGAIFTELCVELAGDLSRKGYAGKTIGIKLRFDDFRIVTRDLTLPAHTMDARTIRRAAGVCLKRVDLTRRLRLLGVRAGTLARLADLVAPAPHDTAPDTRPAVPAREEPSWYGLPLFETPPEPDS
jgi:DNA polymerase-4